eukprot:TRINITY_DN42428_c0_g1_i1.p1 TRINITY_DN42428_c0_g1~~TRINITY_DN42428_c0_g1_i1.p1  ORF type:complete len:492 (+),score=68.15 TRINITY_DN42428_c0_g1_i1:49-1476(+)
MVERRHGHEYDSREVLGHCMTYMDEQELAPCIRQYIGSCVGGALRGISLVDQKSRDSAQPRSGDFNWIRLANDEADRAERREIARRTEEATQCRGYVLDGLKTVLLPNVTASVTGTRLISPTAGDWPSASAVLDLRPEWKHSTKITIVKDTVPGAAVSRCSSEGRRVAAINAASAYHSGGGFSTGGRHALEEAICVQSTLFESLKSSHQLAHSKGVSAPQWCQPIVQYSGKPWVAHLPDDGALLSPFVEFFRKGSNDGYAFEDDSTTLEAVISVAMPNCNRRMNDSPVDACSGSSEYMAQLERRWRAALTAAAYYTEADCVVVPDAGCGVFMNPPEKVGAALANVLKKEFNGRFAELVVAFPGGDKGPVFSAALLEAFNSDALLVAASNRGQHAPLVTVASKPIWEFSVRAGYERFDADCQDMVEAQYQVFVATSGEKHRAQIPVRGRTLVVDFKQMTQWIEGNDRIREVRRRMH